MTLNKLKQIRNELKQNAEIYDEAFKNTALLAAEGLAENQKYLNGTDINKKKLVQNLDKTYFIAKYGSLKRAKEEYKKIYTNTNYGKSWDDFIKVVKELPLIEQSYLSLEQRIEKIENILRRMGQDL
ncbi:MAG: hypothetical protein ACRC2R_01950 [Xenococcaceae cyanobacterium]